MFITKEFTTLVKGDETIRILPGVEFDYIPAGYKITAYALIKDKENNVIAALHPGDTTKELKESPIVDFSSMSIKAIKEALRNEGITFPSKATKSVLLDLLG